MQNKFGNFIGGFIAGRATSGSATTLVDSNNNYEADMLIGKVVVIEINGIQYVRKITDNDATSITFATITPSTVAAGTEYQIQQPEGANVTLSGSIVGKNLFNRDTVTLGKIVNSAGVLAVSSQSWAVTGIINIEKGKPYISNSEPTSATAGTAFYLDNVFV